MRLHRQLSWLTIRVLATWRRRFDLLSEQREAPQRHQRWGSWPSGTFASGSLGLHATSDWIFQMMLLMTSSCSGQ